MQIRPKMEAGDCPTLNMNAMENYLLSHSLISGPDRIISSPDQIRNNIKSHDRGRVGERANFGKIKTKDGNFHAHDFGKIGLKIGEAGCLGVYL